MPRHLPTASVLTLARGRDAHLRNMIRGLAAQSSQPRELVIAVMQDELYTDLPEAPFPVRQIPVIAAELPLARARNTVADAASGEVLIFLDVDCIPHPDLVADYAAQCVPDAGVMMGEVLYLPAGATDQGLDFAAFDAVGERHSDRQGPPPAGRRLCGDYRCFWSLTFAMHRDDWAMSGGFDEAFQGYGGEDTDYARMLDEKGVPIWWIRGARAYHQYHPHCMPPIHHVASILRNTEVFAAKWGHRTMEHWLHGFRMLGLIEDTPQGLRMLREPGPEDFALCTQTADMPYANSARVIRELERRELARTGGPIIFPDAALRHARMTVAQDELLHPPHPVPVSDAMAGAPDRTGPAGSSAPTGDPVSGAVAAAIPQAAVAQRHRRGGTD